MTVKKEAMAGAAGLQASALRLPAELEEINRQSKKPLTPEEVYLFAVRLCDNQVDRDEECFTRAALEQLAPLFVGKSGIFDHNWSAKDQTARIYRTEVVAEPGVVEETGEAACYLKGYAYMLRSARNEDLIAEIEAGIKKEVSVSCAVGCCLCSICGKEMHSCGHVKGGVYDGRRCVLRLENATDAFEWSFVAVPAQRGAGVMKSGRRTDNPQAAEKQKQLEREAAWGRKYLEHLRSEVVRLGLLAQEEADAALLSSIATKLNEEELYKLKAAYETQAAGRLPIVTQLSYREDPNKEIHEGLDKVFCI